jgi:hypothetical protein
MEQALRAFELALAASSSSSREHAACSNCDIAFRIAATPRPEVYEMNGTTLAQVLLRVWGVVLIVWALASVGSLFLLLVPALDSAGAAFRATAAASFVQVLVFLIAGIALVRNGDRIGAWLASDLDVGASTTPASPIEIEAVAFVILGTYLLVSGIGHIASFAVMLLAKPRWDETSALLFAWKGQPGAIVSGVVYVTAGAILLLRRRNIAAAVSKTWRMVRRQDDPSDDQ